MENQREKSYAEKLSDMIPGLESGISITLAYKILFDYITRLHEEIDALEEFRDSSED